MKSAGACPDIPALIRKKDVRFDPESRRGSRIRNRSHRVVPIAEAFLAFGGFAHGTVAYERPVPARAIRPGKRDAVLKNLVLRKPERLADRHQVRLQALALGHFFEGEPQQRIDAIPVLLARQKFLRA